MDAPPTRDDVASKIVRTKPTVGVFNAGVPIERTRRAARRVINPVLGA
jgi:hypothetical protein